MIIKKIRSVKIDYNDLFVLESYYYQEEKLYLSQYVIPSMHDYEISVSVQKLTREAYLIRDPRNSENYIMSVKGKEFYEDLWTPENFKKDSNNDTVEVSKDDQFEEWWKLYPTTPAWKSEDGTVSYIGSRSLKNITKKKARTQYLEILNQGIKHKEMIESLTYEIAIKKLDSVKKNANQMEYFKGMESYLNQSRYLSFIDLSDNEKISIRNRKPKSMF